MYSFWKVYYKWHEVEFNWNNTHLPFTQTVQETNSVRAYRLKNLLVAQLVEKIPSFYGEKFHYLVNNS